MKRFCVIGISVLLLISMVFCGCDKEELTDYIVNSEDTINLGVIVSSQDNNGIFSGITYAAELAGSVNIDKSYNINTKVALTSSDMLKTASEFASASVAAVICEGTDKETTEAIISAFSEYKTPVIFTDYYSDMIDTADNVFSISIPYSYQVSAVVSHLITQGFKKGAFIGLDNDSYSNNFAEMFDSTFTASGGDSVTTYFYGSEDSNYNAKTISAAAYDFIFIAGNFNYNSKIYSELIGAGVDTAIVFSEVADKTLLEASEYNSVCFVSKFESDDSNYIGTDFINTFAEYNNISTSDVTASIAYGYDAYMTVYDALVSMHKNHDSIFITTDATETDSNDSIYTCDVTNAIKDITHMGVTDVIQFAENGTAKTSFVYLDRIDNARTTMLQRYNYAN